jgi:hypothetical protein
MTDEERIAIAREFNDAFAEAPFADLRAGLVASQTLDQARERLGDGGIGAFAFEHLHPNVEIDIELPGAAILTDQQGIEGWFSFFREWLEPWENLKTFPSNYTTDADRVLVDLRVEAQGAASGVPVDLDICQVWTIDDAGKIVGYGVYPDRNRALALHYRGA